MDIKAESVLDKEVKLSVIIDLLSSDKFGYLQGREFIENKKPYHGSCCCCQTCGRSYDGLDSCVCNHNELLNALMLL